MKLERRNIIEIIIVILAVLGVFYAFYNVLSENLLKSENRFEIQKLSDEILKEQKSADRLECYSVVYAKNGDKLVQDKSETIRIIHDYENGRIQTIQSKKSEIVEYAEKNNSVYSKGITPVYVEETKEVVGVSTNTWYHYGCEQMYGAEKREARIDVLSYGYLSDIDNIIGIDNLGKEEIDGKNYTKYAVTIKNSLREDLTEDMGDTGLRKKLSMEGLNASFIKNGYPKVYDILKEKYNRETEDLLVWIDEDGKMTRIEKDYTFTYYTKVIKENSDIIEDKIIQYDYPQVLCVQTYKYNLESKMIELPQKFVEL